MRASPITDEKQPRSVGRECCAAKLAFHHSSPAASCMLTGQSFESSWAGGGGGRPPSGRHGPHGINPFGIGTWRWQTAREFIRGQDAADAREPQAANPMKRLAAQSHRGGHAAVPCGPTGGSYCVEVLHHTLPSLSFTLHHTGAAALPPRNFERAAVSRRRLPRITALIGVVSLLRQAVGRPYIDEPRGTHRLPRTRLSFSLQNHAARQIPAAIRDDSAPQPGILTLNDDDDAQDAHRDGQPRREHCSHGACQRLARYGRVALRSLLRQCLVGDHRTRYGMQRAVVRGDVPGHRLSNLYRLRVEEHLLEGWADRSSVVALLVLAALPVAKTPR